MLGYLDEIPICTQYELDGERTDRFPATASLQQARPVYETLKGWKSDISGIRRFEDLPPRARDYVLTLERLIEVPIRWISVGPRRDQMIERP